MEDLPVTRTEPIYPRELHECEAQLSELLQLIAVDELAATKAQRAYLTGARDVLARLGRAARSGTSGRE